MSRNGNNNRVLERPTSPLAIQLGEEQASQPGMQLVGTQLCQIILLTESFRCAEMSKTESLRSRQKHVADRVRALVKASVFRCIKFIKSDIMFQKAFKLVIDQEAVPLHQRGQFQILSKSEFNKSLNTKRSSCEQAGRKIVRESIAIFKDQGEEEFFTIDNYASLVGQRRKGSVRHSSGSLALTWSVCVEEGVGNAKAVQLVSKATEEGGRGKFVTKSDEAIALLLFDNYIEKWKKWTTADASDEGQQKQE